MFTYSTVVDQVNKLWTYILRASFIGSCGHFYLVLSLLTALLRCNLYSKTFTSVKHTSRRILVYLQSGAIIQSVQFSVRLFAQSCPTLIPWTAACQASLSITNSQSLLKLMPIESEMPSNHLILCRPLLLLLSSMFPSIRIFSNESVLCIR